MQLHTGELYNFNIIIGGICGRVVRVVDLESFAPYRFGFESHQVLWIRTCEETIQLAHGTFVVLLRFPLMPRA